jgi:hypothetical protein
VVRARARVCVSVISVCAATCTVSVVRVALAVLAPLSRWYAMSDCVVGAMVLL